MRKFIAAAMSAVMLLSAFPITAQAANENSSDAETAFYVSPDGSDSNSGTESEPFKTIEKARAEVRKHTKDMTSDIVVSLKEDVYKRQMITVSIGRAGGVGAPFGGRKGLLLRNLPFG